MTAAETTALKHWQLGKNTHEIAEIMKAEEAWVYRTIAKDQERRVIERRLRRQFA